MLRDAGEVSKMQFQVYCRVFPEMVDSEGEASSVGKTSAYVAPSNRPTDHMEGNEGLSKTELCLLLLSLCVIHILVFPAFPSGVIQ